VSINNNQQGSRLVYENATRIVAKAGLMNDQTYLTQSDLRLEQAVSATKTSYQFAILNNNNGPSGTLFNTEIRLTQQDSFVASQMGFYLGLPSSATDATFILHAYPSPAVFTTSHAAAEVLYNSVLAIMVNNVNVLPVLSLGRFRAVPQSQQVAPAANQNGIAQDQIDLSSDGKMPVEPNILFIGSKGNIITVTLPAVVATVDANMRMILWFGGVLAQNSTIIT
jgi:hypothetical protein